MTRLPQVGEHRREDLTMMKVVGAVDPVARRGQDMRHRTPQEAVYRFNININRGSNSSNNNSPRQQMPLEVLRRHRRRNNNNIQRLHRQTSRVERQRLHHRKRYSLPFRRML